MSVLLDIWHAVHAIVTTADLLTLAIMLVIAIATGFMMQNMSSLVTATFVALLAFALASYAKAVLIGHQAAAAYAQTDWHNFMGLQMMTFVAYALTFAVVIGVVHLIRSLVFNR